MDRTAIMEFLEKFSTQRLMTYLAELDLDEMLRDPLIIVAIVALALLALYLKKRLIFVTILSATALAWLLNFMTERGTEIESMNNPALLVFIGIGCGVVGLIIYFVFIRSD